MIIVRTALYDRNKVTKMKNPIKIIYKSSKEILSKKNYLLLFLSITLLMVAIFILIPALTIPGNDIKYQLSLFTVKDYIALVPLASLISLMFSMQIYAHKRKESMRAAGKGTVGGSSGIIAGIFGTASCPMCVAAIFGFLGTGAVVFLVKYQWYVFGLSSSLVLVSLYLTSLNIEKNCEEC